MRVIIGMWGKGEDIVAIKLEPTDDCANIQSAGDLPSSNEFNIFTLVCKIREMEKPAAGI